MSCIGIERFSLFLGAPRWRNLGLVRVIVRFVLSIEDILFGARDLVGWWGVV